MTPEQKNVFDRYVATGRCAFYRPRKRTVSINGKRDIPIKAAIKQMQDFLTGLESN